MTDAGAGSVWNKNSWHWEEKKYTPWANAWLTENLSRLELSAGGASVRVTAVDSIKGDTSVNIRKGKKIVMFELTIKCSWEGKQDDATEKGTWQITEVFPDDVADGDYTVRVRSSGSKAPKAKRLMSTKGVEAVKAVMTQFVEAIKERDGDLRALAADKARREEEAKKAAAAEVSGAAGYAAASAEVEAEEAARKVEESKKAPVASDKPEKVDGTGSVWNKGSYHWEEKKLTSWANARLRELVEKWELEVPNCSMRTTTVSSCMGEAAISIRKGKKLCFFELTLKGDWEAELLDDDGEIIASTDGEFTFVEVDQDNSGADTDDPFTMRITCSGSSSGEARLATLMKKQGQASLREIVAKFAAELREQ